MRLSRRTNIIILWITSIGLLVGMVITFTPTLGALGGGATDTSAAALVVNGETIRDLEVAQLRQSSQLFTVVTEGEVAEDLDLLLRDTLIRDEVVRQEADRQRVSNGEVRTEVDAFRVANGVDGARNDQAYLRLIGGAGYTDETFRDYVRDQLQVRKYQAELTDGVTVSDEEVRAFYDANLGAYQTDARVRARQIVVADADLAGELREQVLEGASFADLAAEVSLERAEVGGAVGGDEPEPVGRPAFPQAVASAVFSRSAPGLTPVIESAGNFYLVNVEEFIAPEARPFDEVRAQVEADTLAAKQQAALDDALEVLLANAEVTVPEGSILPVVDPVVAVVGGETIYGSELARATYTNPQIQQALSPQTASLIVDFFKPSILEQLIDGQLAVQGSAQLDGVFFGSDDLIAQQALAYVARDAEADAAEIQAYYDANLDRYTVPANADVLQVEFPDAATAETYREAVIAGDDPVDAAEALNVSATDLGVVTRGRLRAELDTSLFDTDAYTALAGGVREVSDVLVLLQPIDSPEVAEETATDSIDGEPIAPATDRELDGTEQYIVLVAIREDERILPLDEVRSDAEAMVLANERQQAQREWLDGLREDIDVEVRIPDLSALEDTVNDVLDGASQENTEPEGGEEAAPEGGAN